jgi:short subunit dehydrogenase-like uncharacterized protein
MMSDINENKRMVAVFGATGHTGRFVVAELVRRGILPIAIARNPASLAATAFPSADVIRRHATINDAESLDRALQGAQAVINCAGPFADTAEVVAGAALRAGIHYLDVCAEQIAADRTLAKFDEPARAAGVAVIPSMAFYGGFADLLATAALGDWEAADSIEVMIGLNNWHPTRGTRVTIDRNVVGNMMVAGGRLEPVAEPRPQKQWNFGGLLGEQGLVEVPFSEAILIARHLKTSELHNYLSVLAVSEVLDPATPTLPEDDTSTNIKQHFVVDVVAKRGDETRRATISGDDIYAISAPLICEAVERLLDGRSKSTGARTPGEVFDAGELLATLAPHNSTYEALAA